MGHGFHGFVQHNRNKSYPETHRLGPAMVAARAAPRGKRVAGDHRLSFRAAKGADEELSALIASFRPSLTPKEVLHAGAFGGTYFRDIYSSVTGKNYKDAWKDFFRCCQLEGLDLPKSWLRGLDVKRQLARDWEDYDASVNKYGVKCGNTLEDRGGDVGSPLDVCRCGQRSASGAPNLPDSQFCTACGQSLQKRGAIQEPLGVPNQKRQKKNTKLTTWRCEYKHGVDIRAGPDINESRVPHALEPGEEFLVEREEAGVDGVLYLKLADGRGWVFDQKPNWGVICAPCKGGRKVSVPTVATRKPEKAKPNQRKAKAKEKAERQCSERSERSRSQKKAETPKQRRSSSSQRRSGTERDDKVEKTSGPGSARRSRSRPVEDLATPTSASTAELPRGRSPTRRGEVGDVAPRGNQKKSQVSKESAGPLSKMARQLQRQEKDCASTGWTRERQGNYKALPKETSLNIHQAVEMYTQESHYYAEINYALRVDDGKLLQQHAELIAALRQYLSGHQEQGTVYRGVHLPASKHESYTVGKTFLWPGFTSTTRDKRIAYNFGSWGGHGDAVLFEIVLSKREGVTYARDISNLSVFPGEQEVLIYCYSGFEVCERELKDDCICIKLKPYDTLKVEEEANTAVRIPLVLFFLWYLFLVEAKLRRARDVDYLKGKETPRTPQKSAPATPVRSGSLMSMLRSSPVPKIGVPRTSPRRRSMEESPVPIGLVAAATAASRSFNEVPAPDVPPPKIDKQLATPPKEPNASRRRARSTAPQAAQAEEHRSSLPSSLIPAHVRAMLAKPRSRSLEPMVSALPVPAVPKELVLEISSEESVKEEDPGFDYELRQFRQRQEMERSAKSAWQAAQRLAEQAEKQRSEMREKTTAAEKRSIEVESALQQLRQAVAQVEQRAADRAAKLQEQREAAEAKARQNEADSKEDSRKVELVHEDGAKRLELLEEELAEKLKDEEIPLISAEEAFKEQLAKTKSKIQGKVLQLEKKAAAERRAVEAEAVAQRAVAPQLAALKSEVLATERGATEAEEARKRAEQRAASEEARLDAFLKRLPQLEAGVGHSLQRSEKTHFCDSNKSIGADKAAMQFAQWLFSCADARPGKHRSSFDPFETQGLELHEEEDLQAAYRAMAGMRQGRPDPHVVVFLDVDGVLHAKGCELDHFSAANMRSLRHIVLSCNATVVLSSSWRRSAPLLQRCELALARWGLAGFAKPWAQMWQTWVVSGRKLGAKGISLAKENFQQTLKKLAGQPDLILEAFEIAEKSSSIKPKERDYIIGIAACGRSRHWQQACELLSKMYETQVHATVIAYNATISACARGGQWQQALNLLEVMPSAKVIRSAISYSAAISACEKGGQWQHALNLFDAMGQASLDHDVISYNTTISACEKGGEWQTALSLLDAMPAAGLSPDVVSYSAAVSSCEKATEWQQALEVFQRIHLAVSPDVISYSAAISACEKGGQWQQAVHLFQEMISVKVERNAVTYNATISACEKRSQWQQALTLFDAMPTARVAPNLISYSATISACKEGHRWQEALNLLESMPLAKVHPEVICYSAAVSSCEMGSQWQQALCLFEAMCSSKVYPDVISYSTAIMACEKGGQWQQALNLFNAMPKAKVGQDAVSVKAVIGACEKGGVADTTPDLKGQGLRREEEILIWLKRHPEVQHWLALDDLELASSASEAPMARLMAEHFVKTDPETGLRDMTQVSRALRVLERPRGNVEEVLKRKRATQRTPICA
eukprot:s198_g34.t1